MRQKEGRRVISRDSQVYQAKLCDCHNWMDNRITLHKTGFRKLGLNQLPAPHPTLTTFPKTLYEEGGCGSDRRICAMAKYSAETRTTSKEENGWSNTEEAAHRLQTGKGVRTTLCKEGRETVARERPMASFLDCITVSILVAGRAGEHAQFTDVEDCQKRKRTSPHWIELETETSRSAFRYGKIVSATMLGVRSA